MRRGSRPMTKAQRNFIETIEKNLKIKYQGGNNLVSAGKFLDKHAREHREYCKVNNIDSPTTTKQLLFIKDIEAVLEVKFTGTTLNEATEFINDCVAEYYPARRALRHVAKIQRDLEAVKDMR